MRRAGGNAAKNPRGSSPVSPPIRRDPGSSIDSSADHSCRAHMGTISVARFILHGRGAVGSAQLGRTRRPAAAGLGACTYLVVWRTAGPGVVIARRSRRRRRSRGPVCRHVEKVPWTSLSLVEALLPVIVVLSIVTVPPGTVFCPPPIPEPTVPSRSARPGKLSRRPHWECRRGRRSRARRRRRLPRARRRPGCW